MHMTFISCLMTCEMAFRIVIPLAFTCFFYSLAHSFSPLVVKNFPLWISGDTAEIDLYRTPIMVDTPGGLLAFAGARKTSSADQSAKVITMRRSLDGGETWKPTVFVVQDFKTEDGYLNLGTITIDHQENILIIIYCFCVHDECNINGTHIEPANFILKSYDWGYTWTEPVDMSGINPAFKNWRFSGGPGYGFQKQYEPHKGRLVTCGHVLSLLEARCLYSDDHGKNWTVGGSIPRIPYQEDIKDGDFVPGEPQPIELPDGSILMELRNNYAYHCKCRIFSVSLDGGESFPFDHITIAEDIPDSACQGSLLYHNDTQMIFFSNPSNPDSRKNMTIRWGSDGTGNDWLGTTPIYTGESGYSALSLIDKYHIGLLYEKDGCKIMEFVKIQVASNSTSS